MERRSLLKALAALPLVQIAIEGEIPAVAAPITPGYYMVFVDESVIDMDGLAKSEIPVPGVEMQFIPVRIPPFRTIHEVVAMFKVEEKPKR